jgi:hypothetical protein
VWPFAKGRDNQVSRVPNNMLVFKSSATFFEYQCKYGLTDIREDVAVAALVLDAQRLFGWDEPVGRASDGSQFAVLRVASRDGGFEVAARTPSQTGEPIHPDDLVLWVPAGYCAEVASAFLDQRSSWIGFIRAKVLPEFDVTNPRWVVTCRYDFQ